MRSRSSANAFVPLAGLTAGAVTVGVAVAGLADGLEDEEQPVRPATPRETTTVQKIVFIVLNSGAYLPGFNGNCNPFMQSVISDLQAASRNELFDPALLVSCPTTKSGRGQAIRFPPVQAGRLPGPTAYGGGLEAV